jgi:hypothetical protein
MYNNQEFYGKFLFKNIKKIKIYFTFQYHQKNEASKNIT